MSGEYDMLISGLEFAFAGIVGCGWGIIIGLACMPDGRKLLKEALRFPITKLEEWAERQREGKL